jgi:hypothetical protein
MDVSMLDVDPLLALRKNKHEQLMLNDMMELPIGSIKDGPLLRPGGGLEMGKILRPPQEESVAHTKLRRCAS